MGTGAVVNVVALEFSMKMLAVGAVASWLSITGLAGAWVLYFDKKSVALALLVIISKYAFLMLIIYWLLAVESSQKDFSTAELAAGALGFVGYLFLLSLLLVARNEKEH